MQFFNVYFTITGPAGSVEVDNKTNPVVAVDIADLLRQLADRLPTAQNQLGLYTTGVRVERVEGS